MRELRNVLERVRHLDAIPDGELFHESQTKAASDALPVNYVAAFKPCKEDLIRRFEREYLHRLLDRCGGNVSKGGARGRGGPEVLLLPAGEEWI